jgi:hypothetical protein
VIPRETISRGGVSFPVDPRDQRLLRTDRLGPRKEINWLSQRRTKGIPVENEGGASLPQFPQTPAGLTRMEHLPTVEACIRYWEAVRAHAIQTREAALEWTARGLRASFEQARQELTKAEPPRKKVAARRAPRGRLPPEPSRDGATDGR